MRAISKRYWVRSWSFFSWIRLAVPLRHSTDDVLWFRRWCSRWCTLYMDNQILTFLLKVARFAKKTRFQQRQASWLCTLIRQMTYIDKLADDAWLNMVTIFALETMLNQPKNSELRRKNHGKLYRVRRKKKKTHEPTRSVTKRRKKKNRQRFLLRAFNLRIHSFEWAYYSLSKINFLIFEIK